MIIEVNESQIRSLDQVRAILDGTHTLDFAPAASPGERHEWVAQVLRRFRYDQLKRPHRGTRFEPSVTLAVDVARLHVRMIGRFFGAQYRTEAHIRSFEKRAPVRARALHEDFAELFAHLGPT